MQQFDFSPLLRTIIGFDRLSQAMSERYNDVSNTYPPYNIIKVSEDSYVIEIAVAGFKRDEIDIITKDGNLIITGKVASSNNPTYAYLYKGIASRDFERKFSLSEYVEVTDAAFEDGLIYIKLERKIPEEKKPKKITFSNKLENITALA